MNYNKANDKKRKREREGREIEIKR